MPSINDENRPLRSREALLKQVYRRGRKLRRRRQVFRIAAGVGVAAAFVVPAVGLSALVLDSDSSLRLGTRTSVSQTSSPSPSPSRSSPSPIEKGAALDPNHLPELPSEGIAIGTEDDTIVLVGLDGKVLGHLAGFEMMGSGIPGPLRVTKQDQVFSLEPRSTSLKTASAEREPLAYGAEIVRTIQDKMVSGGTIERGGKVLWDSAGVCCFERSHQSDFVTLLPRAGDSPEPVDTPTWVLDLSSGTFHDLPTGCKVADRYSYNWYLICARMVKPGGPRSTIEVLKPSGESKELVPAVDDPPASDIHSGFWRYVSVSPDGSTFLGQWSDECEVQEVFMAPASGGKPVGIDKVLRAEGRVVESFAIGWTKDGQAIVAVPGGFECSDVLKGPGIYLVDKHRHATFVYGLPTMAKVALWRPLP